MNGKRELNQLLNQIRNGQISPIEGLKQFEALRRPSDRLYYRPIWEAGTLPSARLSVPGPVLIMEREDDIHTMLEAASNVATIRVKPGASFRETDPTTYEINPKSAEDFRHLAQLLAQRGMLPTTIIHHWAVEYDEQSEAGLAEGLDFGFYSVYFLTQAFMKIHAKFQMLFVFPAGDGKPLYHAIHGFARSLFVENPSIQIKTLAYSDMLRLEWLAHDLQANDTQVHYAEGMRWIRRLQETEASKTGELPLKEQGVYLITGGTGGLGYIFAQYLAKNYRARLVLSGRSAVNEAISDQIRRLEADGAHVLYVQGDISNREDTVKLVTDAKARFGVLNGVIHAAGIVQDAFFLKKTESEIRAVIAPKVLGTSWLDEWTANEPLDFFVLFSSISSELGNAGQTDYTFGNSFMDYFAAKRDSLVTMKKRFGRTLSLNWPYWAEGGMSVTAETVEEMKLSAGIIPMSTAVGIEAFEDGLRSKSTQWLVAEGDVSLIRRRVRKSAESKPAEAEQEKATAVQNSDSRVPPVPLVSDEAFLQGTIDFLKKVLSEELGVSADQIKPKEPFEKYGIDSVMVMGLNRVLEEQFGSLSKTLFYEYQNIDELADYFVKSHHGQLLNKIIGFAPASAAAAVSAEIRQTQGLKPEMKQARASSEKPTVKTANRKGRGRFIQAKSISVKTEPAPMDIAIIGVAGRYPQADNVQQFWENLKSGKDSITEVPADRWDHAAFFDSDKNKKGKSYSKWGGFVNDVDKFDPLFFNISPKEAEMTDPQERLFLETVYHMLEDAGYTKSMIEMRPIGVYVGVMYGEYQLYGVEQAKKGHIIGVSTSYASIANRISYNFNLSGPSLAIDTMCSSSLTSIHLASESLRRGETEMAIAGGVNVSIHPNKYLVLAQGRYASSDGRCRSFGEGGDGYVPGEGVGAVLLKPLSKAMEDGDHIYAVIKGTSINHGGKTNGYTVPNPNAQSAVIADALQKAGVDSRTISYIEAHGTGTSLGDPIEITGLAKAFGQQTEEQQFCSIGSAKSNIGHLESAAGIAGITKVLLQMKHRQLVPSLHADTVNPNIDFEQSPFYLQRELTDWHQPVIMRNGREVTVPRRAGVSSFGAGGSNAHIVLEEYTPSSCRKIPFVPTEPQLIVFSAKNQDRLKELVSRMLDFLSSQSGVATQDLIDIAYTLQVGRESLDERLAIKAESLDQLLASMRSFLEGQPVPGLISGKVRRGSELTTNEQGDAVDRIAMRWVYGEVIDWAQLHSKQNSQRSPQRVPLPGYPFARERYWVPEPEGLKLPKYSNGQARLHAMIDANVSTLDEQRFEKRFDRSDFYVRDHAVGGRMLLPGAAYLEMAVAAGQLSYRSQMIAGIKNMSWNSPITVQDDGQDVFISLYPTANGVEFEVTTSTAGIDSEPLVHAEGLLEYGSAASLEPLDLELIQRRCHQVRKHEQFYALYANSRFHYGEGMRTVQQTARGGKEILARLQLADEYIEETEDFNLHPALLDGAFQSLLGLIVEDEQTPIAYLPYAVGKLELIAPLTTTCFVYACELEEPENGVREFDMMLTDEAGHVLVKVHQLRMRALSSGSGLSNAAEKLETISFRQLWEPKDQALEAESLGRVLLLVQDGILQQDIKRYAAAVATVQSGDTFEQQANDRYTIRMNHAEDYERLVSILSKTDMLPDTIIHMGAASSFSPNKEEIQIQMTQGIESMLYLTQALMKERSQNRTRLLYVYTSHGERQPQHAAIAGFLKSLRQENPNWSGATIDLGTVPTNAEWIRILRKETASQDVEVRYVNGSRSVKRLREVTEPQVTGTALMRENGVYLITGGAGGLGLKFADYLARRYKARLVLAGRSALHADMEQKLSNLRSLGSEVLYVQADVTDRQQAERLIEVVKAQFSTLHGIIHSAGVVRDSLIIKKSRTEMAEVMEPKIYGAVNLDEATAAEQLDWFVMFSSLSGVLGNIGQCDYAYSNQFLDEFAALREVKRSKGKRSGRTLSLNWPLWKEGGMQVSQPVLETMKRTAGLIPMSTAAGYEVFETALASDWPQWIALEGEAEKIRPFLLSGSSATDSQSAVVQLGGRQAAQLSPEKDNALLLKKGVSFLKEILSKEIRLPAARIDEHEALDSYGLDSVMIMALTSELESHFGELSKTLFFEFRTLAELTQYFVNEHRDKLMAKTGLSRQDEQAAVIPVRRELAQLQPLVKSERKPRSSQRFLSTTDKAASEEQAVAIIGVAGRYPEADDVNRFWENLKAGRDSISEIPSERWDHGAHYEAEHVKGKSRSKWGGFLDDADKFDPLFFQISPREAELLDPQERLFLMTVHQALEDGGYTKQRLSGKDVGVYVGVMYSDYQLYGAQETISGNTMALGSSYASIANRVSYFYDLQGPSLALDTMCSSSLTAIHLACESLLRGESEMAIAGGVNLSLHVNKYLLLSQNNFLASDGRCRSFGSGGDGYVPGEGVGAVILKPLKQAIEDGDPIYAVIKGTAVNHGGKTNGYTVPNPQAQTRVIEKAIKKAKVDARTISYLEAHGTGTPLGDPIEVSGLAKAFGNTEERQFCSIGSVKSNIGHLESAAGIAALTKVLLQMKHGMLAPSLHADVLNPNIRFEGTPFYVQRELSEWKRPVLIENGREMEIPRRAGISSFGAGGSNAHIILEEFVSKAVTEESDNKQHIIVLSARNEDRLRAYAGKLAAFLNEAPETNARQDVHIASANEIEKQLLTLISEGLSVSADEIAAATDVSELGLDELKLTHIAMRLNEVYSLNVAPDRLAEHATVNSLMIYVIHALNNNKQVNSVMSEDKLSSKTKPALADIAWTLQYGREPMDERLALIVSSVAELVSKLQQYALGKEVDGLYAGNVKSDSEKHSVLLEGAEGKLFLNSLIENQKLDKMANLWVSGVSINWQELRVRKGKIVPLPSYPFARDHYWAPTSLSARSASIAAQPVQANTNQKQKLLLVKSWREQEASAAITKLPGTIFILANAETLDTARRFLQGIASTKIVVLQNAADADEGMKAAQQYLDLGESVSGLIDLSDLHEVPHRVLQPSLGKLTFVQELIKKHRSSELRLMHITNGLQSFRGASPSLAGADMAGLMRMLHAEYRKVTSTTIDIDYSYRDEAKLRELVLTEWATSGLDNEICCRQNRRYLPQLEEASAKMAVPHRLDTQKGYIVTGGTRGIGSEMARHLVRKGARKLVLMGLQAYPPRSEWEILLQSESISELMSQRLHSILDLEKSGVEVEIYAGSLTDRDRLAEFFREVRKRFGRIGGVIHCAGLASSENPAFMNKSAEEMSRVFEPKISGLQALHDLLANDELEFFILFSSVSGLLPALAAGGSDYAVANSFMDFFAAYQRSQGFSYYQSLQWPNWKEVGMGEAAGKIYSQLGLELLTTEEGLSLLDRALSYRDTACIMPAIVRQIDFRASVLLHTRPTSEEKQQQLPSSTPSSVMGGASVFNSVSILKKLFSDELKIPQEQLEIHTPFSDFGVDSVLLAELVLRIEGWLKVKLDPGLLLEYPTLSQLSRYLDTHFETGKGAEPEGNGLKEHELMKDEIHEFDAHEAARDAADLFVQTGAVQQGKQQVAVIGMACHFPGAEDKDAYWSNLIHGRSSVIEVPKSRWDADQFYATAHSSGKTVSKWGGFLDNIEAFDPGYFQISEEDAPFIDPLVRQFLEVSVQTVRDAGYDNKELWNRKIGVFVGSRVSNFSDKLGKPSKNTIIGIGQNFIAAHCSHFFNWKGPNLVVDTACSSSLVSLHLACQSLMNGESEMALAGGVDILLDEKPYLVLSEGRGLSPDGKCHTFDEKANGFVPGEGSGAVLLKPLDKALRDGDRIYAVIDATAVNNDGHTMGITTPNPEGQYSVIREAMQRGGINARSVSYIETHGTGTMIGDPIELKALTRVFNEYSEDRQYCGVGSVKTNFGHTLSAAGIASFIKVILAIKNKQLPPTLNCERPNPRFEFDASPFYPVQTLRDWSPDQSIRRAGISGFGFGGTNAHVIVSEGDPDLMNHYVPVRKPLEPAVFNRKRYWFNKEQETKAQPSMLRLERLR